jgi:hypothetical protein
VTKAAAVLILMHLALRPCWAQWHLGLELSTVNYHGSSRDTSGISVGPGAATAIGIRVERHFRRVHESLRLSYAHPGFAASDDGLTFIDRTTGSHFEIGLLSSFRVGGIGPSGAARVELGPALQLWNVAGEVRSRVGAVGVAAYEWPVAGRWTGRLRLEGMLSKSWFDAADVPPEVERRVTWRYGVGISLLYRL